MQRLQIRKNPILSFFVCVNDGLLVWAIVQAKKQALFPPLGSLSVSLGIIVQYLSGSLWPIERSFSLF